MREAQSPAPQTPAVAGDGDVLDTPQAGPIALRGGALRTAGYALSILLSIAVVPLLIRHIGVASYGRYVTIIALITIVAGLTEGGLNAIALREYTTTKGERRRALMSDALGLRLVLTSVGALAAIGFAAVAGYGSRLVLGTVLAACALIVQMVQSLVSVALQSELRFGWVTAVDLMRQVVNSALIAVLVLAGAGIVPLLGAALPAALVALVATLVLVRGRMPLRPSLHLARWWPLLRDGIGWAAVAALNVVYFRLAIVIMSIASTALQTGYFGTSFRIVEIVIGIPGLAVAAAYPILTRSVHADRARFAYATGRLFELTLIAGTLVFVLIEAGAPFAIHVLAGHRADPAITVLRIQGVAVVAAFVTVGVGYPLLTLGRYRQILIANFVALLLSAALTPVLADALGARGAAIATVAADLVLGALCVSFLARAGGGIRLALGAVPTVALAGIASAAVGVALPVHPLIGALVGAVLFGVALRLFGRFPPEARELVRFAR